MKKLLVLAAFVAGMFLVSCSSSVVKPTGDPEKDARALVDYTKKATKDMADAVSSFSLSKAGKISQEMDEVQKAFNEYYEKDSDAKAKFEAALQSLSGEMEDALGEIGKDLGLDSLFGDLEENTEVEEAEVEETVEQ